MPRVLKTATAPVVTENGGKKLVEEVMQNVASIAEQIKQAHSRIGNTVMEIGKHFFSIRQLFDAVPAEVRRVHRVPSFTVWMNKTAPTQCGMSERTVWHYYRNYSEGLASGLKSETIVALAPTVLKNEKSRKAILTAITKNPSLAVQLNEAASKPAQLRKIASSQEVQDILKKIEAPTSRSRVERIESAVMSVLKPVFNVSKEEFDVDEANLALADLNTALHNVSKRLGITSHLSVTFSPWTEGTYPARAETEETVEEDTPKTVAELVKRLESAGITGLAHRATA